MPLLLTVALLSFSFLGQDAILEHARQVNLERAAKMPNFVADETAKRSTGHVDSPKWRYDDTIETEITVKGTQLTRQNWRRNGKPWKPFTGFHARCWVRRRAETTIQR